MPPKENEVELSELYALEEQVEDLKDALYDARKQLKNAIIIPRGATNGDMIKAMFPDMQIDNECNGILYGYKTNDREMPMLGMNLDWWNAPYKRGEEE